MSSQELRFVPLGGVGEIGMNVYLYGLDDSWLMVDLGLTFADDRLPGADLVLPDIRFAEQERDRLKGLVLTHAHEDHLGAVPHLWPRLRCPIWCSPFTAAVLRRKLAEEGISAQDAIRVVQPNERFTAGPFRCRLLHVTHSIPEAGALVLETDRGTVLHSGDWKLDPAPMVGERTDDLAFEELGKSRVLALVCDSTNVLTPGTSGSEAEVRDSLIDLIAGQPERVVLTTFASNVARLATAITAAHAAGREVCVVGRSMRRMIDAAREVGYLEDFASVLDEREAAALPRKRILYLCTGSQGEARSALTRIALGQHPRVRLEPGDTAIFSSKIIPGNERTLYNLHNQLVGRGVEVITEEDHFVHVSGHPCRGELEQMYRWIKPEIAVPIHGEARHLAAHIRLARDLGVAQAMLVKNGDVLRLAPGAPAVVGEVPVGRRVLESDELVDATDDLYRERRRLMNHGSIFVTLVLDELGTILVPPRPTALGVLEGDRLDRVQDALQAAITGAVEQLDDEAVLSDGRIQEAVRSAIRQALDLGRDRRPFIEVQVIRLSADALDTLEDEEAGAT